MWERIKWKIKYFSSAALEKMRVGRRPRRPEDIGEVLTPLRPPSPTATLSARPLMRVGHFLTANSHIKNYLDVVTVTAKSHWLKSMMVFLNLDVPGLKNGFL